MASRILLLLDRPEDRRLLAAELSPHYDVIPGESDDGLHGTFDLCVLDGSAFGRLRDALRHRKEAEHPLYLPTVLVISAADVPRLDPDAWQHLDEVIVKPVERRLLRSRIETLLHARRLSLELLWRAEEAERATRTRDDVLAVVAHDLRNPVGTIAAAAELLDMTRSEEQRAKQTAVIRRTAKRMDALIQDLLDVSRMQLGKFDVDPGAEDAASLIAEACEAASGAAEAKRLRLERDAPERLPPVMADRAQVMRAFSNLIGNATKFTGEGGRITVGAEPLDGEVRFSVADTGPGIPPKQLSRLFNRFWRAEPTGEAGAGLGLAISKGIVEAHGGRIWADSRPGRGSTFHFTLPVAAAATERRAAD